MNLLIRVLGSCAAFLVLGCGPQWEGRYTGDLTWGTLRCTDGSTGTFEPLGDVGLDIYEGDSGEIAIHIEDFGCGPFSAKVEGNKAVLEAEKCDPFQYQGYTWQESFTAGTFTLEDQDLDMRVSYRVEYGPTGGMVEGSCTSSLSGQLWRPE